MKLFKFTRRRKIFVESKKFQINFISSLNGKVFLCFYFNTNFQSHYSTLFHYNSPTLTMFLQFSSVKLLIDEVRVGRNFSFIHFFSCRGRNCEIRIEIFVVYFYFIYKRKAGKNVCWCRIWAPKNEWGNVIKHNSSFYAIYFTA